MCPQFHAFHQDSGFQYLNDGPLLVVPQIGIGLVRLCNVPKNFRVGNLKFDRRLAVELVSIADIGKYVAEYLQKFPGPLHDAYRAGIPFLQQQLSYGCVLLAVRARIRGRASIEYPDRRNPTKLNVYAMPWRRISVSFRYVSFLDQNGALTGGTKRDPSEAGKLVDFLNRFFFPKTNIEFELKSVAPITIREKFGDYVNLKDFSKHMVPQRDTSARITIFFAGKYQKSQVDANPANTIIKDGVIIISDFPVRKLRTPETTFPSRRPTDVEVKNAKHPDHTDWDLQWVLTHEVTHVIANYDGHNSERGDLMSEPPSVIDRNAGPWLDDFNLGWSVLRSIAENTQL